MTEYRVSDKIRDIIKNESRTVAIQTEALGQLERAMEALRGIEVSVEKGFVGSEDADYLSVVVYGNHFFTPYERGYRDLSADDYMTFDEAFESIPEQEQDTPNDKLFESRGPLGGVPKPEPGVKYLWESRKKNQEGGGKVVLFMHKEEGVMGMGISGLRWYENLEQAQDDADTHLTVEELEEQGFNPDKFTLHPLEEEPTPEPERFIWVTPDESGILYRNGKGLIDIETLITMEQGYQHEKSHLTEDEVEDSMYDTRKFTKKPVASPAKAPRETYRFTDKVNELCSKESFTVTADNQEQADILTDLLGGLAKVGIQYSDRSVELFLYKDTAFRPDFLSFRSDGVPNLSFEEAVEAVL